MEDGSFMYCLWIAKDLEDQDLGSRFGTLTLASKDSSTLDKSLGEVSYFLLQKKRPSNIYISYPHTTKKVELKLELQRFIYNDILFY